MSNWVWKVVRGEGVLFKFLLCSFNSPSPIPRSFSLPPSLCLTRIPNPCESNTNRQAVGEEGWGSAERDKEGLWGCYFLSAWRMCPLFLQSSFSAPEQSRHYLKLISGLVWNKSQNTWTFHTFFGPARTWIMNPCEIMLRQCKGDTTEVLCS